MMTTKLMIAAIVAAGMAGAPLAAQGYGTPGLSTPQTTYGTSGASVGTVTAPSVGSYNWPSVGVTNAVPTWRNTNPPVPR